MSAPIGPGDWVECIGNWPDVGLARGSLWLCEDVIPPRDAVCELCGQDDRPTLILRGWALPIFLHPDDWAPGLCACGFKPVYRQNDSIILALKQPAPERELEPADA